MIWWQHKIERVLSKISYDNHVAAVVFDSFNFGRFGLTNSLEKKMFNIIKMQHFQNEKRNSKGT